MNSDPQAVGLILNELKDIKIRTFVCQRLIEQALLNTGLTAEQVYKMTDDLTAEGTKVYMQELTDKIVKMFPDVPPESFGLDFSRN